MSKIFNALKKTDGEIADIVLPAVSDTPDAEYATMISDVPVVPAPVVPAVKSVAADAQFQTVTVQLPPSSPLLPYDGATPRAGEQYRIIRTKVLQHPAQPHMIAVSSAGSGDGKTVTAVNLAGALAMKNDLTVLLIDADLRRSALASVLGLPNDRGLAEVLAGECEVDNAILRTEQFPNLYVLPAGTTSSNPAELLDSPNWRTLCASVRKRFRYVILDTPPIASVADYDLVQQVCDGLIVVVRPDHTNKQLCLKAFDRVTRDKLLGVVVNCVEEWFLQRSHSDYYYYSRSSKS